MAIMHIAASAHFLKSVKTPPTKCAARSQNFLQCAELNDILRYSVRDETRIAVN